VEITFCRGAEARSSDSQSLQSCTETPLRGVDRGNQRVVKGWSEGGKRLRGLQSQCSTLTASSKTGLI